MLKFIFLVLTLVSLSACKDSRTDRAIENSNPSTDITVVADEEVLEVLLESETSGGFCRGTCPVTKIRLYGDGTIMVSRTVYIVEGGEESHIKLGSLSGEVLEGLNAFMDGIVEGNLQLAPNQDVCADAPITIFYATVGGERIAIYKSMNCQDYFMSSRFSGRKAVELMASFFKLNSFIN